MHQSTAAPAAAAHDGEPLDAGRVGLWLFLLSEILLFGAFLASYASARLGSSECGLGTPAWPAATAMGGLVLATVNTVILLSSSWTMVRAISRAERGDIPGTRSLLTRTLVLGASFLAVKSCEYALKIEHGLYPGSPLAAASPGLSIFLSYYYLLTIFHAIHVIAGLAWLGVLRAGAAEAEPRRLARQAELAGLYWHFVDAVWVLLFPLLYLI